MTDIEERAKKYSEKCYKSIIARTNGEEDYIQGATDQDPISRADERKKVIEKAFRFMLKYLYDDNQFLIRTDAVDKYNYPIGWEALYEDDFYEMFKKAMEEQQ